VDVVSSGAAGNWFLAHRGLTMLKGQFEPGFQVALHSKDLKICKQMAEAKGFSAPSLVQQTLADYERLIKEGSGQEDISVLFRLKEQVYTERK
jgi:3-hydroxyisobutyrate dehydrogenase